MPNLVRGAGVPQMVHLGARTGFVHELQMSHRQTWLILRDIVVGQPLGSRLALISGRHVVSHVCVGTPGLRSADGLHRGCARGVGQRLSILPLCCHSALQARDRPSLEAVPGAARGGDRPYDSCQANQLAL